jgi:hypothetical protein
MLNNGHCFSVDSVRTWTLRLVGAAMLIFFASGAAAFRQGSPQEPPLDVQQRAYGQALEQPRQLSPGQVIGKLTTPDGKPVQGASVILVHGKAAEQTVTKTTATGRYHFNKVFPSDYAIRATSATGCSEIKRITVAARQTQRVNLAITPGSRCDSMQ